MNEPETDSPGSEEAPEGGGCATGCVVLLLVLLSIGPTRRAFDALDLIGRAEVVVGTVVSIDVPDVPKLTYRYTVDGKSYERNRVIAGRTLGDHRGPLRGLDVGDAVEVFVVRDDPEVSFLIPTFPGLAFCVTLLLIFIVWLKSWEGFFESWRGSTRDGGWRSTLECAFPRGARRSANAYLGLLGIVLIIRLLFTSAVGGWIELVIAAALYPVVCGIDRFVLGRWSRNLVMVTVSVDRSSPQRGETVEGLLELVPRPGLECRVSALRLRAPRGPFGRETPGTVSERTGGQGDALSWGLRVAIPEHFPRSFGLIPYQLRARLEFLDAVTGAPRGHVRLGWPFPSSLDREDEEDRLPGDSPPSPLQPAADRSEEG